MKKIILMIFCLVFIISSASALDTYYGADENTAALWHFNEGSGNYAYDESGNSNTGTLNNPQWTTGLFGDALSFDGEDDVVVVPFSNSIGTFDEITIEAWIKRDSNQSGAIVDKNGPYSLIIFDDKLHGKVYTGTWNEVIGTTSLNLDEWYNVKMTYDGDVVSIFLNGELEASESFAAGPLSYTGQNLYIGFISGATPPYDQLYFDGIIDEIRISNISREEEIIIPGDWWNEDWGKKREITINENSGAIGIVEDYSVRLILDKGDDMSENCGDIRFVDSLGQNELPYWIESCGTEEVIAWVKTDLIGSSETIIYMYYWNNEAVSTSDINNTFILGDDFDENNLDTSKWTAINNAGSLGFENGIMGQTCPGIECAMDVRSNQLYGVNYSTVQRRLVPGTMSITSTGFSTCNGQAGYPCMIQPSSGSFLIKFYTQSIGLEGLMNVQGTSADSITEFGIQHSEWSIYETTRTDAQSMARIDYGQWYLNSNAYGKQDSYAVMGAEYMQSSTAQTDWVAVRKFNYPEPTYVVGIAQAQLPDVDLQILPEGIIFSDEQPLRNATITITALFDNLLDEHPETITVNFYLDEINEQHLIGTDVIENFRGDSYFAQIDWLTVEGTHEIIVFLDPYGDIPETNGTNNIASREILVIPPKEIKLGDEDVGLTNYNPEAGHQINMLAMLHNLENIATDTFSVTFLLDNTEVIAEIQTSLEALQTKTLTPLFTAVEGFHEIHIYADYYNEIEETNEINNLGITSFTGTEQIHCTDGTLFGECSNNRPRYCDDGILINDCHQCGCPKGGWCKMNGQCQGLEDRGISQIFLP